jgi:hypothetical protein
MKGFPVDEKLLHLGIGASIFKTGKELITADSNMDGGQDGTRG